MEGHDMQGFMEHGVDVLLLQMIVVILEGHFPDIEIESPNKGSVLIVLLTWCCGCPNVCVLIICSQKHKQITFHS
jgi:hypothetical protein